MAQKRRAATVRDGWSGLPEDILFDIIDRLSAKAIRMCRCICRSWRTSITKHLGVIKHDLVPDPKTRVYMFSKSSEVCLYSINGCKDGSMKTKRLIEFTAYSGLTHRYLAGSSNRLACFMDCINLQPYEESILVYDIVLWNPYTNKIKIIKSSLNPCRTVVIGFGFVHETGDYKVVKLEEDRSRLSTLEAEVYSLISDSWKSITCTTSYALQEQYFQSSNAYMKGCAHWIAWTSQTLSDVVLSFNMVEEKFHEMNMPPLEGGRRMSRLTTFRDSLALFTDVEESVLDVWVMKDYGIADSWSRLFRLECYVFGRAFEIMDSGKILKIIFHDPHKFIYYDPETREEKELVRFGESSLCLQGEPRAIKYEEVCCLKQWKQCHQRRKQPVTGFSNR